MHSVITLAPASQIHLIALGCERELETSFCYMPRKERAGILLINVFYISASRSHSCKDCPVFKQKKRQSENHTQHTAQALLIYSNFIPNLLYSNQYQINIITGKFPFQQKTCAIKLVLLVLVCNLFCIHLLISFYLHMFDGHMYKEFVPTTILLVHMKLMAFRIQFINQKLMIFLL